jgi:hypothetical protein
MNKNIFNNLDTFLSHMGGSNAYQVGRSFYKYNACGPWMSFHLEDGTKCYYEDKNIDTVNNGNCVGIEFGSIVEGSDMNSGPFVYMFPFSEEDFDKDVEYMEKETTFYWERDNSQFYLIATPKKDYYLQVLDGEMKWEMDKPKKQLRDRVELFLIDFDNEIPLVGHWGKQHPPVKIPNTRCTIIERDNDATFD